MVHLNLMTIFLIIPKRKENMMKKSVVHQILMPRFLYYFKAKRKVDVNINGTSKSNGEFLYYFKVKRRKVDVISTVHLILMPRFIYYFKVKRKIDMNILLHKTKVSIISK